MSQQLDNSSTGGIVTGFQAPHEQVRQRSLAIGTGWDLRFLDNTYDFEGFAATTHRQVPDLDSDNQTGFAGSGGVSRRQGTWTYSASVELFDHRFDPNDVGMLRRNNYFRAAGGFGHQFSQGQPFGWFQRASINTFNYQE